MMSALELELVAMIKRMMRLYHTKLRDENLEILKGITLREAEALIKVAERYEEEKRNG